MERGWVTIDHVEEDTIQMAIDEGFWAGITRSSIDKPGASATGSRRK